MSELPAVGVVGGGGFGRGLAHAAARTGRNVVLWSRTPRDLGDGRIRGTADQAELADAELLFVAVPSTHVPDVARSVAPHLDGSHLLVHVSRGLVGPELQTLTQILRQQTPCRRVGALAGPLVADALAEGTPGGGIVGTRFPEVADAVHDAIAGPRMRIYRTTDVIGVEVASAMVGLLALATGYARQMGFGPATLAVLLTRGMAEAARIGTALGAEERTFHGLAGFGDLLAAVAGDGRPELRLGEALARGASLPEAGTRAGAHIEGVAIAGHAALYAARLGTEAPIAATLASVLEGQQSPQHAMEALMARHVQWE